MPKVYMVRHGRAAANFTSDRDPGLDDLGRDQAVQAASLLAVQAPLALLSSPLKRAQETAVPIAEQLKQAVTIDSRVAEVPSHGIALEDRGAWLQAVMQGQWSEQSEALQQWRDHMAQCLMACSIDTAIFSHFVAINAMVSYATQRDEVLVCRPDNGSITLFEVQSSGITLIDRGSEATTHIN